MSISACFSLPASVAYITCPQPFVPLTIYWATPVCLEQSFDSAFWGIPAFWTSDAQIHKQEEMIAQIIPFRCPLNEHASRFLFCVDFK